MKPSRRLFAEVFRKPKMPAAGVDPQPLSPNQLLWFRAALPWIEKHGEFPPPDEHAKHPHVEFRERAATFAQATVRLGWSMRLGKAIVPRYVPDVHGNPTPFYRRRRA